MELSDRIEERLATLNMSQAELARRAAIAQSTINSMIRKGRRSTPHLAKIARELETTAEYLLGETDDPSPANDSRRPVPPVISSDDDDVEIDSIDLAYGLGGTFVDDDSVEVEKAKFSRSWLRKFTDAPPERLFSTAGAGDSMWPTIHDRDEVIVDRSSRVVDQGDKIWAIVFGGVGMIKRLRPLPDGTVKIMSDNQQVRDELATDSDLFVVGRVAAIVRRV